MRPFTSFMGCEMRAVRMSLSYLVLAVWLPSVAAAEPPFPVAEAQYQTVTRERVLDGVVEAVHQSTVSAQTSGRIVEVLFDIDDFVAKDAVILRFSDTEQRARLAQARAALGEAQARLREAQSEHDRIKDIFERNLVSRAEMDRASAELNSARARLEAAQARVREAEEQLAHTVVRAPYSGYVVRRHVEVGETANPGQPLMTGVSLETLRVTVDVPSHLVAVVREAGRARIELLDGRTLESTQLTVFPFADPQTRTFTVRVGLPEALAGLFPGTFAKVAFAVGEEQRLTVPAEAVVHRSELTGMYVVAPDGRVSLRQVRTGRLYDGEIEVLAGLEAGEHVALDPVQAGVYLKQQLAGAGT
jgi:RND family efflux transporter MFP subunit